ncbi:WD40-repeat-containing domain protein [Rhodocollybia butyracea]|uniref:WD40-repeat-containing domain protein n=1 Tax=Rhodocollybia butyracea TaxID=206335 RepID=A0A9P5Q823_9AGAR|nr:WD40-repeat-containing domain protein [Rhodocollybia butyracea]
MPPSERSRQSRGFSSGTLLITSPRTRGYSQTNLNTPQSFTSSVLSLGPSPPVARFQENPSPPINSSCGVNVSFQHPSSTKNGCRSNDASRYRLHVRECDATRVYTGKNDKVRRVLTNDTSLAYLVSMRGTIDTVDTASVIRRDPIPQKRSHIVTMLDDACLVSDGCRDFAILGHVCDDASQVSLIRIEQNSIVHAVSLKRPWNISRRGGVGSLCTMDQLTFATGGYDHVVHLWKLNQNYSSAFAQPLAISHSKVVQSLLPVCDTSHKLMTAGADCKVHVYDLSSERVVNTIKTSKSVYHLHGTHSPFCTLIELGHLELQFELRDHRMVPVQAVQRFGYPAGQTPGRYMKGASLDACQLFSCGDKKGNVRLWDLRNTDKIVSETSCFPKSQRVAQVLFHNSRLLASSENGEISVIDYLAAS